MNEKIEINIAHLYPELMNINGDSGNVKTLENRIKWRNIIVNTTKISKSDDIDYKKYDIYFLGGGQDKEKSATAFELQKHKGKFKELADDGVVMLAICGGYQIFGHYYQFENGEKLQGIGLFDAYTIRGKKRHTGNATIKTDFLTPNTLVGFESHRGNTYLNGTTKPLGKAVIGCGNNPETHEEGVRYNNVFGTYLHGPILPKNHAFCDYLIQTAIRRKIGDNNFILPELDDKLETLAHNNLVNKSY